MPAFPLITALLCLWLSVDKTRAATAHMSWTFKLGTENYVNDQTKIAFRKSVGGFHLNRANLGDQDGTAIFSYAGNYGVITVYFSHRGPMGCGKGVDCAAGQVNAFRGEMKRLYGKYDLERSFGLQRRGSPRGCGTTYHFLVFRLFDGKPAYSEVGALEVGDFVWYYRATFMDKAGLANLVGFLKEFGVRKV